MSSSYRRKLRKPIGSISKNILYSNVPTVPSNVPNSELITIQNKFCKILDNIILYNDFSLNISELHSILESTRTIVDYHKLIDDIQNILLSVVCNISNSVNSNIIQTRIDYIKTYIDALPEGHLNLSPLSDMILRLIDHIVTTMDFSSINNDINTIQLYINKNYNTNTLPIENIQNTILSIICNIGQNTNTNIITNRIQYLRELIDQL
jgi:hypothetical protein